MAMDTAAEKARRRGGARANEKREGEIIWGDTSAEHAGVEVYGLDGVGAQGEASDHGVEGEEGGIGSGGEKALAVGEEIAGVGNGAIGDESGDGDVVGGEAGGDDGGVDGFEVGDGEGGGGEGVGEALMEEEA